MEVSAPGNVGSFLNPTMGMFQRLRYFLKLPILIYRKNIFYYFLKLSHFYRNLWNPAAATESCLIEGYMFEL